MTLNRNSICSPFLRLSVQPAMRYGVGEMKMTHWLGMSESVPVVRERIEEASLILRNQRQKPGPQPPPPPHCVLMFNRMNDDRSFFIFPPFFFDPVAVLQSQILRTKGRLRQEEQQTSEGAARVLIGGPLHRQLNGWRGLSFPPFPLSHSLNKNRADSISSNRK